MVCWTAEAATRPTAPKASSRSGLPSLCFGGGRFPAQASHTETHDEVDARKGGGERIHIDARSTIFMLLDAAVNAPSTTLDHSARTVLRRPRLDDPRCPSTGLSRFPLGVRVGAI
jgi:hypothetical protein